MKRYLGDSVCVDFKDGQFILTTEDGFGPSNTIILEQEVANNLMVYFGDTYDRTVKLEKREVVANES